MGKTRTDPMYTVWRSMRDRCNRAKSPFYHRYGGRGIKVCPEWDSSFERFVADMGERPLGTQIDRIDNDAGYFPGNCRWATPKQNCNNTVGTQHITHDGVTRSITEWAEELGIPIPTLWNRIKKLGWSVEDAFSRRVRRRDPATIGSYKHG